MNITDRQSVARALAETYTGGYAPDPWERVTEYQRVLEYTADHPNKGSTAVATALELPRGRIRPWMDSGARPDPVRAIQTAEAHGWLDLDHGAAPFTGLNTLVAWIFSAGAVATENYVPTFHVTPETHDCLEMTLALANVSDYRIEHTDDPSRATELRPTTDQTALGRLLVALGAPLGEKNTAADIELPSYLAEAPETTRITFAQTYVWNRATDNPERENHPAQVMEDRSDRYRRELQALLDDVAGGEIRGSDWPLYLTPAAAATLDRPPQHCE
jgi:hypothetical protein